MNLRFNIAQIMPIVNSNTGSQHYLVRDNKAQGVQLIKPGSISLRTHWLDTSELLYEPGK